MAAISHLVVAAVVPRDGDVLMVLQQAPGDPEALLREPGVALLSGLGRAGPAPLWIWPDGADGAPVVLR